MPQVGIKLTVLFSITKVFKSAAKAEKIDDICCVIEDKTSTFIR